MALITTTGAEGNKTRERVTRMEIRVLGRPERPQEMGGGVQRLRIMTFGGNRRPDRSLPSYSQGRLSYSPLGGQPTYDICLMDKINVLLAGNLDIWTRCFGYKILSTTTGKEWDMHPPV